MTIDQAIDRACQEPTLVDALSWICLWECERVVAQALRNVPNNIRDADGKSWDTCFGYCIRLVMDAYGRQKPFNPAFDMPTTPSEAIAVITKWGDPTCMTFSSARSKRCAELLAFEKCDRGTVYGGQLPHMILHGQHS
jgi:hypothetical protein